MVTNDKNKVVSRDSAVIQRNDTGLRGRNEIRKRTIPRGNAGVLTGCGCSQREGP